MTSNERASVEKLMEISYLEKDESKVPAMKQTFLNEFTVDVTKYPHYVFELLQLAFNEKNADDVEYCLMIGSSFSLFTAEFSSIFCDLILSDWHHEHENIASILQGLKCPNTVSSLYKATLLKLDSRDWDDMEILATKCIWALGDIGNSEAIDALKLLSTSSNKILCDGANYQLKRLNLK